MSVDTFFVYFTRIWKKNVCMYVTYVCSMSPKCYMLDDETYLSLIFSDKR